MQVEYLQVVVIDPQLVDGVAIAAYFLGEIFLHNQQSTW